LQLSLEWQFGTRCLGLSQRVERALRLDYLTAMGFTESLFERVETIIQSLENICVDEIKDIHVSDFITDDGSRDYDSLWLFSDNFAMEAKQLLTTDNFDIA
jgi:hypothetical protein